jgi:hypothetical protein
MNTSFEGKTETGKDEWLTPPEIIKSLGEFDLDPCSPINRPWDTAKNHYTIQDDGLLLPWNGRVWLNPPYGNKIDLWLQKAALHQNCMVLIFARTDTASFHANVFNQADSILFIKGRLKLYHVSGKQGDSAGAPSCLVSYNKENSQYLKNSNIKGKLIILK